MSLSPEQQRAVEAPELRVLVRAGPGAGKTRVLVARIRHLLELGVAPHEILAITFTRRAAAEVLHRVGQGSGVRVCTFHAWCLDLVERHCAVLHLLPGITVREQSDVDALYVTVGAELGRKLRSASKLREDPAARRQVEARMRASNTVSYDELETLALRLLETRTALAPDHVLVDEVQDTSPAQQALLQACQSVFAVGDPSQMIYEFRGADMAAFRAFAATCTEYRLLDNYRSTVAVVERGASISLALPPLEQRPVTVERGWTGRIDFEDLAEHVGLVSAGEWSRCAVLAPTWDEVEHAAAEFKAAGVPHYVARPSRLWSREGAFVVSGARSMRNKHDRLSLEEYLGGLARSSSWLRVMAGPGGSSVRDTAMHWAAADPAVERLRAALLRGDVGVLVPEGQRQLRAAVEATGVCEPGAFLEAIREPPPVVGDGVVLTTCHGAKGAEWDHVWVLGAERMLGAEDERKRLLYVATTRARHTCAWVVGGEVSRW